jgi:hypothetical protein
MYMNGSSSYNLSDSTSRVCECVQRSHCIAFSVLWRKQIDTQAGFHQRRTTSWIKIKLDKYLSHTDFNHPPPLLAYKTSFLRSPDFQYNFSQTQLSHISQNENGISTGSCIRFTVFFITRANSRTAHHTDTL